MRYWFIALLATLSALPALAADAPPLRVLVVTGDHPYDVEAFENLWRDRDGLDFTIIELTDKGEIFDDTSGWEYDVMALYNMSNPMHENPGVARTRYANFAGLLERGVGLVVMHHGLLTYAEWPETQEIYGLNIGQTGPYGFHMGQTHTVEVADPDHPITQGMDDFEVLDETYTNFYGEPKESNRVLLTTSHDPSDKQLAWVRTYANARVFAIQLGHDANVFLHPSFQTIMLRGVRWVAGRLPHDAAPEAGSRFRKHNDGYALRALTDYEFGRTQTPLDMLAQQVDEARGAREEAADLARDMAALLDGEVTEEARRFVVSQLGRLGSDAAVPALEPPLRDPEWCDDARMALERIATPAATQAVREALDAAPPACRPGVAQSLGALGDAKAAPALARGARGQGELAKAAALALGRIPSEGALQALLELAQRPGAPAPVFDGLLTAADRSRTRGDEAAARRAYETCRSASAPARVQAAALVGLTRLDGDAERALAALRSDNRYMQEAGLAALRFAPGSQITRAAAGAIDGLPADMRPRLIARLAERGDRAAVPVLERLAADDDAAARPAAIRALARLGDAAQVPPLLQAARSDDEAVRAAAKHALARMPGERVDQALLTALRGAQPGIQVVAAKSLAARVCSAAVDDLLATIEAGGPRKVVQACYEALGRLLRPEDMPAFTKRVAKLSAGRELTWAAEALEDAAGRAYDPAPHAAATAAPLEEATQHARLVLIRALGAMPSQTALDALLRAARHGRESERLTAVRALGRWPTPAPRDALLEIARHAGAGAVGQAALTGHITLTGESDELPEAVKAAMLQDALQLAEENDVKRAALDELGQLHAIDALRAALPYLDSDATRKSALNALVAAATKVALDYPEEVAQLLEGAEAAAASDTQRAQIEELRASLDAFMATLKAQWSFNKDLEGWGGENDCELSAPDGSLVAHVTGDDPFFAVACDVEGGPSVVKVRGRFAESGFAQLFWSTNQVDRFGAPEMIATFPVEEGVWEEYAVPIEIDGSMTALRLDPAAMGEGTVRIDWIRIFSNTP